MLDNLATLVRYTVLVVGGGLVSSGIITEDALAQLAGGAGIAGTVIYYFGRKLFKKNA